MIDTLSIPHDTQNPDSPDAQARNAWQLAEAVSRLRKQQSHLRRNGERALASGKHADADRYLSEAAKKEAMAAERLDWLVKQARVSVAEAERLVTLTDGVGAGAAKGEKAVLFARLLHAVAPSEQMCRMLSKAIRESGLDHALAMLRGWAEEPRR